jgi:hypothetical protein
MKISKVLGQVFLFLASVSILVPWAAAQYRASIQGTVTDPQGAAVAGATVTLTNQETGQTQTTSSGEDGVFSFNGLPPSKFTISVEVAGFKTKTIKSFGVIAEQANAVAVQLEVGQTSESVTVNGNAAPLIDTETSNLTGTVTQEQYQKLPSIGRDPFQLLYLAPGAFGDASQAAGGGSNNLPSTTIGGTGATDGVFKIENGGQLTANGARTGENNYQIDGVGTTSVTWGGTSVVTPNEDSIKEVKIITDNYDAENGRYRGAQVQIISQNGTNNYHGSFFFKIHRPGLNAFTKYNGYQNANVRESSRFNDLGGTVGGPILKNRLFVFFSYERLDNNAAGATTSGWYTTTAFQGFAAGGTNAAAFLNFPGVQPNGGDIVDKSCADAGLVEGVSCHAVSGGLNLGSPLTTAIGTKDPTFVDNNTPGVGNGLTDVPDVAFFENVLSPSKDNHVQYNGRVDFNLTKKDLIAFSLYYVPNSSTSINGNGTRLMNLFHTGYKNRAATVIWDHTFSPNLLNEVRVNAAGWLEKDLSQNPNAPWGLPQVGFVHPGSTGDAFQGFGIGSFNGFDQWTYAAKDVLTKVHGAHTMKMGGEFTRLLSVDAPFWADRPGYTFNNIWDFLNDAPSAENAQFDPQTGVPSALRKDLRSNIVGLFFQDNWKVRPSLTVTAGLRWDYFGAISEKNDKLATVQFGKGDAFFTDMRLKTGGSQYNAQKGNFGPQLGFAWSPQTVVGHDFHNRLVVRGGFGIAYNGVVQSNTLDVRFNPPFVSNGQSFSGNQILYINSFPSDVTDPNGYASNPNALLTFGDNNLPLASCLTASGSMITSGCIDLTALPATLPTTYSYHYTLGTEYDLGHEWVASIGYQGSQTRHLTEHYNLYNVGAARGLPLNPLVSGVTYYANDGSAHFNALLLELRHNFSHTFQLDGQYRWSHTLDSGSNAYAGGYYQYDMATNFATSDYDVRHAFKLYGIWSPRLFHGDRSWMEKIAGGWTISGILNAHTGFPFNALYPVSNINNGFDPVFQFGQNAGGSRNDAGADHILPAAYLGGFHPDFRSSTPNPGGGAAFFSEPSIVPGTLFPCLFANPDPTICPAGQQGFGPLPTFPSVGRNRFQGPGYFDVDATLSKSFGLPTMKVIGENGKIELRANFYNLFNKLNLFNIQTDITDAHFGQAQNSLGSRIIELQARFSF